MARVAILGATGAVGRTMLEVLEERSLPIDELVLLASERSAGTQVIFKGAELTVQAVSPEAAVKKPALQPTQLLAPGAGWYVPEAHAVQVIPVTGNLSLLNVG